MSSTRSLYPYQSRLLRLLGEHLDNGCKKLALISPTGSGKSLMVTTLLARLAESQTFSGAVVCVPQSHIKASFGFVGRVEDRGDETAKRARTRTTNTTNTCNVDLHTRTVDRLAEHLEGLGDAFAYVCTHATLARTDALALVKESGDLSGLLLVIDEGHHSTADKETNQLSKLRETWLAAGGAVLLVTATPYRTDGTSVIDESWSRVSRSIADQCADRFAPEQLECRHRPVDVKAKSRKEYEDGGKVSAKFVKAIVHDWSEVDRDKKGNRPKAIVIVPQQDSQGWTKALVREFRKHGARVFDATGVGPGKKTEVLDVLTSEGAVKRWQDSTIDVMIGCKRFDEGTDWPLCSHVYVVGYPVSIGTTVQRWGRATRNKAGIAGHPFADIASITFYVHAWSKELGKDLSKSGRLTLHRETSHLIAAHLHDWETSQQYAKAYKGIYDAMRRGPRKQREKAETIEQALALTEAETAQAIRDVDEAKAKLKIDLAAPLQGPELKQVVDAVAQRRGEDRAAAVAQVIVERSKPSKAKHDAVGKAAKEQRIAGQAQSLVRKEMRAKFRAIVEALDLEYNDPTVSKRLSDAARWNGEQVKELAERMFAETAFNDEHILAAASLFVEKHGRRPASGNVSLRPYIHSDRTWQYVDGLLRARHGFGLPVFLDKHCVGLRNQAATTNVENGLTCLLEEARLFYQEKGRRPGQKDKGKSRSWRAWGLWCRKHLNTTLPRLLDKHEVGERLRENEISDVESACKKAIVKFIAETGRKPSAKEMLKWALRCSRAGLSFKTVRDSV